MALSQVVSLRRLSLTSRLLKPPQRQATQPRENFMRQVSAYTAIAFLLASSATALADETPSTKDKPAPATPPFDIAFGGGVASDYVFRGISQSARWPSVNAYTELRYNVRPDVQLYGAIAGESLDFPNRAAAEIDLYGGIRPTFDKLAFDFGFWYYWYPGGKLFNGAAPPDAPDPIPVGFPNANCTNRFYGANGSCNVIAADLSYWEVFGRTTYTPTDAWAFGANVFYSPSWLNTGADGLWTSGTIKYTIPSEVVVKALPKDIGVFLSGEFGHYFFGKTGTFYGNTVFPGQAGGIELPDYNTWNVGLSFTYKVFGLDFRYYDTDLSRSDCNALTADHTATFSPGNITAINPGGLGSTWCGSAFVAKLSFDMTANTNLK
jgi:hypothetical protein